MKVVIDTSSLLSLVRYYLPFDKNQILFDFIKKKIENKEIIILDKVVEECGYTAKGMVINSLEYIKNKKYQISTTSLLPYPKFFNQLENNFINGGIKNRLLEAEYESLKDTFLKSADCKLLLYSLINSKTELINEEIIIVSEESESSNDNKAFKKLPAICKILGIKILTLPELINMYDGIDLEFK